VNHYVPQRGDDIWLDFNPQSGREQAGRHPAFVVSPEAYNRKVGLLVACPVTSQKKGYPSEVEIPDGFSVTGVTLSDQIKSMDWRVRNASQICSLPENIIQEVLQKVSTLLR
jgi:mRNA interferase MazF